MSFSIQDGDFTGLYNALQSSRLYNPMQISMDRSLTIVNNEMLSNAYRKLKSERIDLWQWLASEASNPPSDRGFIFWNDEKVLQIRNLLVSNNGNREGSGASEGFNIRVLQFIARTSWNKYVEVNFRSLRNDRISRL